MTENIHIENLVERIALLDQVAAFDGDDEGELPPEYDGLTGVVLLRQIARGISTVIGARHGTGSWAASHALRSLTDDDVALLLTGYGATTFTVQQHTERLRRIILSTAAKGGA